MSNAVRILGFLVLALGLANCTRSNPDSTSVALQLPTYSKVNSLTCTMCLKRIIVNVDAADLSKIVYKQVHPNFQDSTSELSSEVIIDVPAGLARKFQIIAVYRDTAGLIDIQYGTLTLDLLSVDPPPVNLVLTNLGQLKGASIVGRYLTAADAGPTGLVSVSLYHEASGMEVEFDKADMINGWFDFFASENFLMKYTMADGTLLFGNPVNLNSFTASNNVARLHMPNNYFRTNDGSWNAGSIEHVTEYHDVLYGFFGASALVNSKKICFEGTSTPQNMSKMASTDVAPASNLLTYYQSNTPAASIYASGGLNSWSNAVDCSSTDVTSADRHTANAIFVSKKQLDGNGNDNAKGLGGAFTFISTNASGDISRAAVNASGDISLKALPSVFGVVAGVNTAAATGFDGIRVFKNSVTPVNGGYDGFKCNLVSLALMGFSEIPATLLNISIAGNIVKFNTGAQALVSDGLIVCPTQYGLLREIGGIYLRNMTNAFVTGTAPATFNTGTLLQSVTFTNSGNGATKITPAITAGTNNQFNYVGGTYPGLGGTCGTVMEAKSSCVVKIAYVPVAGTSSSLLNLNYNNGYMSSNASVALTGN